MVAQRGMMRRAIVWTLGLGMLLAVACVAEVQSTVEPSPAPTFTLTATRAPTPTPTKKPTPTEVPTETPSKTPTPEPTVTPTPEIQTILYLEDNFAGTNRAVFEGPNPRYEGDALFFTYPENGGWLWARTRIPMSNFRLEASFAGDGAYGLNFGGSRLKDEINYDLVFTEDGHLLLNWFRGEVFQGELFDARVISPSQRGGFHTFGLDYDGSKLDIFFNGEKVGEVSKSRLHGGLEQAGGNSQIGLFCWDDGEKNVGVGIDYLAIKLPQELIPPTPTPAPPTPTETPRPPVCEIPHFGGRTPDRKTGYHYFDGKPFQEIHHPDTSPYAPYNNGAYQMFPGIPGHDMWWVREAQVVSVNRERQIAEFYVGRGQYVQRRFAEGTHVIMDAHEGYRGQPMTEALQVGGNFCDLEDGDLVALLHLGFEEAVNLNPDLIDAWGVLIVQ